MTLLGLQMGNKWMKSYTLVEISLFRKKPNPNLTPSAFRGKMEHKTRWEKGEP